MSETTVWSLLVQAVEFGFKAHEKGWNLEMTLIEFRKLFPGWNV